MRSIRIALVTVAIATTASLALTGLASAGANATRARTHVAQTTGHTTLTADIAAADRPGWMDRVSPRSPA